MPRIRTIKPEFWQDEKLQPLSDTARLLFLGLISLADDAGRLVYNPKLIEALLFDPDGPDRSRDVRESLATLSRIGRVVVGTTASGQRVLQILNWAKHQKVDKPNLAAALPEIVTPDGVTEIRDGFANDSRMAREPFATHIYDLRSTTNDLRPASSEPRERVEPLLPADRPTEAVVAIDGPTDPTPLQRAARLCAAANRGITERYGEQTRPIRAGHGASISVLEALDAAGIPLDFAARVLYERARSLTNERPPSTLSYFQHAITDAWQAEQAHREAATFQPPAATGTPVVDLTSIVDQKWRASCIRYAKQGNAEYQLECAKLGIDWEAA